MPLAYDNTMPPYYSEATLAFDTPQNWTAHGIRSLSLWFQGKAGNGGQLYVKINNTKVPYDGSPANLSKAVWLPWNIDLTKVAGSLNQVTKLVIGLEGTGARGTVYIDDVRLYPKAPQYLAPADPGNANLLGLWAFEGNANDTSGHKLNGTLKQAVFVPSGRPGGGSALQVDKAGYVDLGNPPSLDFGAGDWTVSAWFKTTMIGADAGTLYGKGGDDTGGKRYALHMGSSTEGVVSLICDDDKDKCPVDSKSVTNDGQWHCVAAQRAGTELRIYIDGLLEGTLAIPATYDLSGTSQHNAYVGAITNHTDGSLYKLFSGQIDDVRVYNRALTQAEILWLAGQALPAAQPF